MMPHTVVHFLDAQLFPGCERRELFGGCEELVVTLLAGLDRRRWRPMLFYHEGPGTDRLLEEVSKLGIPCRSVPRANGRNTVATLRQFARELHAAKPSVFHAHLGWPLGCRHGLMAARLSRVPAIVGTSHLYSPVSHVRFGWLKQRLQAAMLDQYIAVSNEVKKRLCQDLHVPEGKIRVVHNGIRMEPFKGTSNTSVRAALSGGSARPIILTVARLHQQKGHVYLLEAAAMVPDALFILAGDGPERPFLEKRARGLGLEARVRFLGQRQDIPLLLASCDLFILPSLYEGLPLSVLEAMAAGKPVVATAIGGTDEAVIHGETGFLVPPANPVELATVIRKVLSDKGLASRLAEAGKARAVKMFSSDAMVRGVTGVYEELIQRAPSNCID